MTQSSAQKFAEECERVCPICDALDCPAADGGDPDRCRLVWAEGPTTGIGVGSDMATAIHASGAEMFYRIRDDERKEWTLHPVERAERELPYGITPERDLRARLSTALDLLIATAKEKKV